VDVAVGERDPELPRVGALDGLLADELDLVALLLVVDERAVEVGVLEDRFISSSPSDSTSFLPCQGSIFQPSLPS
jgi:hypothetical protein